MGSFTVCKKCGTKVKNGLQFCIKCGANVETGIVPTANSIGVVIKKQKKDCIKKILKIAAIVTTGIIIIGIIVFFFVKRL